MESGERNVEFDTYKYLFKIVLVGNMAVGKTCLVKKFTDGTFIPNQKTTIGVDFLIKTVKVGEDKVKLQLWDTAGSERFFSVAKLYYRTAHAVVLVYDVTRKPTFEYLPKWMSDIEDHATKKAVKILVGNKVDLCSEREVTTKEGREFAAANGFAFFFETSAKDATNVDAVFNHLASALSYGKKEEERGDTVIKLTVADKKKRKLCCK